MPKLCLVGLQWLVIVQEAENRSIGVLLRSLSSSDQRGRQFHFCWPSTERGDVPGCQRRQRRRVLMSSLEVGSRPSCPERRSELLGAVLVAMAGLPLGAPVWCPKSLNSIYSLKPSRSFASNIYYTLRAESRCVARGGSDPTGSNRWSWRFEVVGSANLG